MRTLTAAELRWLKRTENKPLSGVEIRQRWRMLAGLPGLTRVQLDEMRGRKVWTSQRLIDATNGRKHG